MTGHPSEPKPGSAQTDPRNRSDEGRNLAEEKKKPGDPDRPLSKDEEQDEALDESFPASDPPSPSRIDGPNN